MKKIFLILLITVLDPSLANADYGVGAVRILCDYTTNRFEIEPYIAWNGNNSRFKDFQLEDTENSKSKMGTAPSTIFYAYQYKKELGHIITECTTKDRKLSIFVYSYGGPPSITVVEGDSAPLNKIPVGDAWSHYGPIMYIESESPGSWVQCLGNEKQANSIKCQSL